MMEEGTAAVWHGEGQMPSIRGGGERIPSIVEMLTITKVDRGDPEQ